MIFQSFCTTGRQRRSGSMSVWMTSLNLCHNHLKHATSEQLQSLISLSLPCRHFSISIFPLIGCPLVSLPSSFPFPSLQHLYMPGTNTNERVQSLCQFRHFCWKTWNYHPEVLMEGFRTLMPKFCLLFLLFLCFIDCFVYTSRFLFFLLVSDHSLLLSYHYISAGTGNFPSIDSATRHAAISPCGSLPSRLPASLSSS